MTMTSFRDVAIHVCRQYKERKEAKKDKGLFVKIQEEAYGLWGKDFDFKDMHEFKSELTKLINKIRKEKPNAEEIAIYKKLNNKKKPTLEGSSCFSFIIKQIAHLNLNVDSYV